MSLDWLWDFCDWVKKAWDTVTPYLKKGWAWGMAAAAWLYAEWPTFLGYLDDMLAKLDTAITKLQGLPDSPIYGYVDRVFPLDIFVFFVGLLLALRVVALLARLVVKIVELIAAVIP